MFPHLSGWHAGSFGEMTLNFLKCKICSRQLFIAPFWTSNPSKEKKHQFPSCFCVSCVTLLSERGSLVVEKQLWQSISLDGAFVKSFSARGCLRLSKQQLNFHQNTSLPKEAVKQQKEYPSFTYSRTSGHIDKSTTSTAIALLFWGYIFLLQTELFTFGIKRWPVTFGWLNKIKKPVRIAMAQEEEQAATDKYYLTIDNHSQVWHVQSHELFWGLIFLLNTKLIN